MISHRALAAIIGALFAFFASGCSLSMGSLTAASTRNVPIRSSVIKPAVEGVDCTHNILLLIPLGSLSPNFQEAVDRALASAPGSNALTNVALYSEPLIFLVYNRGCLRVRGDAIKIEADEGVQP